MKFNTEKINNLIPSLLTSDLTQELQQAFNEQIFDPEEDGDEYEDGTCPECLSDFANHIKDSKSWKHLETTTMGQHVGRSFELVPGEIFQGIIQVEVITDGDTEIVETSVLC